MHTREMQVTIRLEYELSGIRAEATLRDDDHPVTGVGWLAHHWSDPWPAREDLAVVRALRDLADRLVERDRRAHLCAPGGDETLRAAAAGGRLPVPRGPTYPIAVYEGRGAVAGGA